MVFDYSVQRSNRVRNVSIRIEPSGEVIVVSPPRFPESEIDFFVNKNSEWIENRLSHFKQFEDIRFNKDISKELIFLGRKYPSFIILSEKAGIEIEYDRAKIYTKTGTKKEARAILENFYRTETRKIAENLISKRMKNVPKLSIRNQKTRWGSCSRKGNLNFNLKLSIAPLPVFNYVVIHELTHLKHFDHSKAFWNEVEKSCPDYKEHRKWLTKNGFLLNY